MTDYKKYENYKKTNIDYIEFIPSHWEQTQIKSITRTSVIKKKPTEELLSVYREYGVIPKNSRNDNHNADGKDLSTYKYVSKNNLVVNKMKAWQGSMGVSNYSGIVSPAYIVCKLTDNIVPKYVHYLLRSKHYIDYYNRISYGVRVGQWDMRYGDFKNLPFFIPPIDEQDKIVSFIEYKEKQINKLIKKQKKLIKLLKEQKSVIINEVVTKGIDKTAQMKDSGIKWLTQIPQHWEIKRTKFVAKSFAKGNGITKDDVILNGNIRCIRYGEIYSKYDVQVLNCVSSTNIDIINSPRYISNGDILFAGTGELIEEIGKNVVYMGSEPCLAGGDIIIMKHKQDALFINYALNSKYAQAQKSFGKVKLKVVHISAGNIGNIRIALPPIEEQKKIAEYLNEKCSKINEIILQKERIITKLIEYKTSLISNAVTGQIDVRDYEIPEIDDDIDLEEIENISEDDTETISEVEYANN